MLNLVLGIYVRKLLIQYNFDLYRYCLRLKVSYFPPLQAIQVTRRNIKSVGMVKSPLQLELPVLLGTVTFGDTFQEENRVF